MEQTKYIIRRLAQTAVILFIVLTFLFFLFRLMPGNFTSLMLNEGASAETVEQFEDRWGLNDPLHVQYFRYVRNYLLLDPGTSMQSGQPVLEVVKMGFLNTILLVAPGVTVAYILGTTIGVIIGNIRGSFMEKYGVLPIVAVGLMPEFFTAILLLVTFGLWLDWFPVSGMFGTELIGTYTHWYEPYLTTSFLHHYVLPFAAVVLRFLYLPILLMRTSVVEVMGQDFIHYHRMTGLTKRDQLTHVAKNAVLPVITAYPVGLVKAISGLVLIEFVFNWPGIGYILVQATFNRDVPVVMFIFFTAASFIIIMNLLVDISYGLIDPRVSVGEAEN